MDIAEIISLKSTDQGYSEMVEYALCFFSHRCILDKKGSVQNVALMLHQIYCMRMWTQGSIPRSLRLSINRHRYHKYQNLTNYRSSLG